MIVSHPLKTVFLHNPKVAGTTIRRTLLRYTSDNPYLYQGFTKDGDLQDMAHLRYDQLPVEVLTRIKDPRWFTFSVCRDPVSKFKSAVSEFLRQHGDWFDEFQLPLNTFLHLMLSPASIKHDWRFIHFCPQNEFFVPIPKVLEHGGFGLFQLEKIDEWWADLWKLIFRTHTNCSDLPTLLNLRPTAQSASSDPLILDQDMLELIAFLYEGDYKYFEDFFGSTVYNRPSIIQPYLNLHCYRIEYIHRHRSDTTAQLVHNGFDPLVKTNDERLNWDLLACFKQETLDLREGTP